MTTKIYSLAEFERIGNGNEYILPENVLKSINTLCNLVGYVENAPNTYINQYNATTTSTASYSTKKPKEREVRERTYKKPKEIDEWKRPVFKTTVFATVDNVQANINDIRVGLNKLKESNCEENIALFIEKIDGIRELIDFGDDCEMGEKMQLIFNTIFSVFITNKMFSKIYATVLVKLCKNYEELSKIFDNKVAEYLVSMQNIIDVDSNIDYDAFCEFTTVNNNRKNITNLFCEIAKTDQFEGLRIRDIHTVISNLLNHVFVSVDSAEKQKEVEEITENIVIIFSHFKDDFKPEFKQQLELLASFKKPGLSSRTKFKYMDLIGK